MAYNTKNGGTNEDAEHKNKVGWMRWKLISIVVCTSMVKKKVLQDNCRTHYAILYKMVGNYERARTLDVSYRNARVNIDVMDVWQN